MDTKYMLATPPVEQAEFWNNELSWTAKGVLFYADAVFADLPHLTVEHLQTNSPGRESDDELEQALNELVAVGLMEIVAA